MLLTASRYTPYTPHNWTALETFLCHYQTYLSRRREKLKTIGHHHLTTQSHDSCLTEQKFPFFTQQQLKEVLSSSFSNSSFSCVVSVPGKKRWTNPSTPMSPTTPTISHQQSLLSLQRLRNKTRSCGKSRTLGKSSILHRLRETALLPFRLISATL